MVAQTLSSGNRSGLNFHAVAVVSGHGSHACCCGSPTVCSLDEQFPQGVNVATQHGQSNIAFKTNFAGIATPQQSVARLQCSNRRLNTGMALLGLMKLDRGRLGLLCRLFGTRFREANMRDDFGKFLLVLGRMEAAIK